MLRFDRYDDAVYAHTDYVKWLREEGDEQARSWLEDRHRKYGDEGVIPCVQAWRYAVIDAVEADILWMTTEMMDLVQTAMEGFDPTERFTMDDVFIPSGFMVLPHSFLSLDINDKTLGWRIITWKVVDHMVNYVNDTPGSYAYTYDLGYEGRPEAGIRFMVTSYMEDEDDWFGADMETRKMLSMMGVNWGIAHATAIPFHYVSNQQETTGEGDLHASWLSFWRVAQKLMQERIVTSERQQPSRAARREAKRFDMPPPLLRVIELRRSRGESEREREGGPVKWTHRWIVRGHWRNQPYKDGVRQKYIGSYVKGPDDLDLVVKTRVWNWDR